MAMAPPACPPGVSPSIRNDSLRVETPRPPPGSSRPSVNDNSYDICQPDSVAASGNRRGRQSKFRNRSRAPGPFGQGGSADAARAPPPALLPLAAVADPPNRPLVDVGADDFVIQEAGADREVLSVRPADYPIIVLLDTGDDPRGEVGLVRKAGGRLLC